MLTKLSGTFMFNEPLPLHIGALFGRTSLLFRKMITQSVSSLGLTECRWRVLMHMALVGEGCSQHELADSLHIEMPSLTRTVKHLEDAGLITRRMAPNDKRSRLLYFTPKGKARLNDIQIILESLTSEVYSGLTDQQLALLVNGTQKIESNIRHILEGTK